MSLNNPVKLPLNDDQLKHLVAFSNTWALSHGIIVAISRTDETVTYAPHTLLPSPYPRAQFEKALLVQTGFNELFWKIARDEEFLTSALQR